MREYTPAELTDVAGNLQQKARESIQAGWRGWDPEGDGISLTQ